MHIALLQCARPRNESGTQTMNIHEPCSSPAFSRSISESHVLPRLLAFFTLAMLLVQLGCRELRVANGCAQTLEMHSLGRVLGKGATGVEIGCPMHLYQPFGGRSQSPICWTKPESEHIVKPLKDGQTQGIWGGPVWRSSLLA